MRAFPLSMTKRWKEGSNVCSDLPFFVQNWVQTNHYGGGERGHIFLFCISLWTKIVFWQTERGLFVHFCVGCLFSFFFFYKGGTFISMTFETQFEQLPRS